MTFYITTPIYYVNDVPHIGTAYTTIIADVLNRYHRLFGEEAFFLTGTDEHGQKVQAAARKRDLPPQAHVDEMVKRFESTWQELGINYDFFIRTTNPLHVAVVEDVLDLLYKKGEIYKNSYKGWYSVSEEIFYTDKDLVDGKSPAGKEVIEVTEENYFFRMSKYQQPLIDYINQHPDFIQPSGKRSEVLGFLKQPLDDLCISRPKSRLEWGIELPFDRDFVTYVWFDALINYISAIGYKSDAPSEKFKKLWPDAIHIIGKDILTPHTVYWPTMLLALGVSLPKTIFAHGWILNAANAKMSKSSGPVVSPYEVKEWVGVEAFRYCLCREIPLGNDAPFSKELAILRVNAELANTFGNLLSRSLALIEKYFSGVIPSMPPKESASLVLSKLATDCPEQVRKSIQAFAPHLAIEQVVKLLNAANQYIDQIAPWKTAKTDLPLAGECLSTILDVLRIAAILLSPVMPQKCASLLDQLGVQERTFASTLNFSGIASGTKVSKGEQLFPRIVLTD